MFEFRKRIMEFFIVFSILSISLVHGFTEDQCNCNCRSRKHISRNVCDIVAEMMSKTDSNDLFLQRYAADTRKIRSIAQNDASNGEGSTESAVIPSEDAGIKEPENSEGPEKKPEKPFTELNLEQALMYLKKRTDDQEKRKIMESELLSKIQESLKAINEILEPLQEAEKKSQKQIEELFVKVQLAENRSLEIKEELSGKIKEAETRSLESEAGVWSKIQKVENHSLKMDISLLMQTQEDREKSADILKKLLNVEKEFKDGLAAEEIERRNLEKTVNETQTMVHSMVASGMEACNATQKKVSASIENLTFYINNTVKDEMSAMNNRIERFNMSLHFQIVNITSEVKDCVNSSSLADLDKELRVLENITKAELKSLASELLLLVAGMEKKVVRLENDAETNTTLRNHSSEISEIWRRINSVEISQQSMQENLTGSVTHLENEIENLKNKTAVQGETTALSDATTTVTHTSATEIPTTSPNVSDLQKTPDEFCPDSTTGWVDVGNDLCYLVINDILLNWYEANFDCQTKGGVLASIYSSAENDLLRPYLESFPGVLHIGLHKSLSNNNKFEWLDGRELTYTNWRSSEPNNLGNNEKCGELTASSMKWNDNTCDFKRGYICSARKIPAHKKPPGTLCPASSAEWVDVVGELCYLISTKISRTWDEANYDCLTKGGSLAIITSDAVNVLLRPLTGSTPMEFWIGLRRSLRNYQTFVWVGGRKLNYGNWRENEPNNAGGKERCVVALTPSLKWNDVPCEFIRPYICSSQKV